MPRFRKRPVVVEAWCFNCEDDKPVWVAANSTGSYPDGRLKIFTLEGDIWAERGDWIIKGVKGEVYPCKPDIFEAAYEAVSDEGSH